MWKQISKINFYRYFNFSIDNSPVFPRLISKSNYKCEFVYFISYNFIDSFDLVDFPLFRRVEYSSGRITYFVSIPFVEWFKKYIN